MTTILPPPQRTVAELQALLERFSNPSTRPTIQPLQTRRLTDGETDELNPDPIVSFQRHNLPTCRGVGGTCGYRTITNKDGRPPKLSFMVSSTC